MLVQGVDAVAFDVWRGFGNKIAQVVLRDQVQDEPMFDDGNIRLFAYCLQKGPLYLLPRNVLVMQDTKFRMAALSSQLELPTGILIKTGTPVDDLLDTFGTLFHDDLHCMRVAKPIPGYQGI